jgi:hypothetical protein
MKYVLFYSENCSPCFREFKTKKAALTFIEEFDKKCVESEDNWIDILIRGSVHTVFEGFSGWRYYE